MKAFIPFYDGIPFDTWAYSAYTGFKNKGFEVIPYEDIGEIPLIKRVDGNSDKVVVGNIEDVISYLNRNKIPLPGPLNVPSELQAFVARKLWRSTLADVKAHDFSYPLFIKPADNLKLFEAKVIGDRPSLEDIDVLLPFPDDTMCFLSEVVDITSEYRGFVSNGVLLGLKHYAGDFGRIPDVGLIRKAIIAYKSAPASYTIDFGVTKENKSILIECNDGWSVDSYGLDGNLYSSFLLARWTELTADI